MNRTRMQQHRLSKLTMRHKLEWLAERKEAGENFAQQMHSRLQELMGQMNMSAAPDVIRH